MTNGEYLETLNALLHPAPFLPRKWSRGWFALAWARWKIGHPFRDCWISR